MRKRVSSRRHKPDLRLHQQRARRHADGKAAPGRGRAGTPADSSARRAGPLELDRDLPMRDIDQACETRRPEPPPDRQTNPSADLRRSAAIRRARARARRARLRSPSPAARSAARRRRRPPRGRRHRRRRAAAAASRRQRGGANSRAVRQGAPVERRAAYRFKRQGAGPPCRRTPARRSSPAARPRCRSA